MTSVAEKRMFSRKIVDSDDFLDMPLSAQALYFHLNMEADDDGFINNPKKTQRGIGASADDLKLLIAKRFLICFENGVVVIKHWLMHNTLRKDRYTPTTYHEQYAALEVKNNKAYTEKAYGNQMATSRQPNGNQSATQNSIDKDSIDKRRIDEISIEEIREEEEEPLPPSPSPSNSKSIKQKYGRYNNVLLTDEELSELKNEFTDWEKRIEDLSAYMKSTGKSYENHLVTIRIWANKDKEKPVREKPMTDTERKNISKGVENFLKNYPQYKTDEPKPELSEEYKHRVEKLKEELGQ